MEGYELQPAKSVALNIKAKSKKKSLNVKNYKLGAKTMPTVESAAYLSKFVCGLDCHLIGLHHLHMRYN
jgi:hypothetical protein